MRRLSRNNILLKTSTTTDETDGLDGFMDRRTGWTGRWTGRMDELEGRTGQTDKQMHKLDGQTGETDWTDRSNTTYVSTYNMSKYQISTEHMSTSHFKVSMPEYPKHEFFKCFRRSHSISKRRTLGIQAISASEKVFSTNHS